MKNTEEIINIFFEEGEKLEFSAKIFILDFKRGELLNKSRPKLSDVTYCARKIDGTYSSRYVCSISKYNVEIVIRPLYRLLILFSEL